MFSKLLYVFPKLTDDLVCFASVCRLLNVSVQMVMWSQHAGGSRTCAAHRHVSTMPPVCRGEMIMSAGEAHSV